MFRNKFIRLKYFLILLSVWTFIFGLIQCGNPEANAFRFFPTSNKAYLPADRLVSFNRYIKENQIRIKSVLDTLYFQEEPFLGKFDVETVLKFRSPEQDLPSRNCWANKNKSDGFGTGFLFLHGLTDSPFSLKETKTKIKEEFPCATFRASILTGHGTVPGDANDVTYKEWMEVVDYSLYQFLGEVAQVFIVGYSTGFTLALEQLQSEGDVFSHRDQTLTIAGIIGLSPAIRTTPIARVTPILKYLVSYLDIYFDQDPVKYESLNLNLAAQFYQLTQEIDLERNYDVPMFMAMTSDDTTVDPVVNYDFYCKNLQSSKKKMIWYQGFDNIFAKCKGMEVVDGKSSSYSLANMSHVAIPFSTTNPVYGYKKGYPHCLSYFGEKISFAECQKNQNDFIYGEENLLQNPELIKGKFFRKATFNPYFDQLMEKVVEFIKSNQK